MNLGSIFSGGGLPMPPLPPGLPNPFGGGSGGGGMDVVGETDLTGTLQIQGGGPGGPGGTIQTEDSGYQQNIAGLLQMLGANQNQPRTTVISGGGLI